METLTARAVKMTTKTGFIELFWEELKSQDQNRTHKEIYEALEIEYYSAFKRRRYTNFSSFRRRRDERR